MKSRAHTRKRRRAKSRTGPANPGSRSVAWPHLALLSLAVLAVYSNSLEAGWHFDDSQNILQNTRVHLEELSWSNLRSALSSQVAGRRPVSYLTLSLNHYFSGLDPRPYHAVNLLIHCINAILVFWTVRLVTNRFYAGLPPATLNGLASLTALLWSLHPIQTQAVVLVVQRMALLATLFSLLSFVCYLQWRSIPGNPRRPYFLAGCMAFALLAFGSKENSAILPFLLILYEFLLGRDKGGASPRVLLSCVLICVLIGGLVAWELQIWDKIQTDYDNRSFSMAERLLTQPRVIVFHLSQMLLPIPSRLALRHEIQSSSSLFSPLTTLFSVLLLVGSLATAIYWRKAKPLYCFWVLWMFLTLMIESSFLPLEMIFEHRFYLPSVGFCGALVALLLPRPDRIAMNRVLIPNSVGYGLVPVLMLLAYWTHERNLAWRDELSLWQDNALKYPASVRVLTNLGSAYIKAGNPEMAERTFLRALKVDPNYLGAKTNLALFRMGQGKLDEAVSLIQDFDPSSHKLVQPMIFFNHAVIYAKQGNLDKAVENYQQALQRSPQLPEAWFNLALIHSRRNQNIEALRCFEEFLANWDGKPDAPSAQQARQKIIELGGK